MTIENAKTSLFVTLLLLTQPGFASECDDLTNLVQSFLSRADQEPAHSRFWADDLVYTSSAGLRFGKAQIMAGFDSAGSTMASDDEHEEPAIVYSGEDFDVRVHGNAAIVAFRLVGTPHDGGERVEYFNTGTFLKRDAEWRAVAWQATKIQPTDP